MQMIHPLWPVVRESARRIVRLEQITIEAEIKYLEQIRKLSHHIAEKIPQRTTFPIHDRVVNKDIWIYDTSKENPLPIVYLGRQRPDEDICWIEMDVGEGFEALIESCLQLLDAGYPGCTGCADSVQEGRWNEREFRILREKNL